MSALELAELIRRRQPCVVLTGAGVSTESGIPDFRSRAGLWARFDPLEYASLYLTPGVRVTIRPRSAVSVFGAVGAGYARYTESQLRADRSPNPAQQDTNAGAIGFGGGVDVRGIGWLGFRGEVRDVYTGARRFSIATPGRRVHNVVASGGLVVRF